MDTAHVYIYGIIDNYQDDSAGQWGYVNLKSVKNQIDAQSEAKEITLHIHSPGGVVTEGFAIHDFVRSQGKPVTTIIEGECYSIATVIALAGDVRKMTSNADFMIHMPWGGAFGESDEIQKYADMLKKHENDVAEFYANKSNITKDQAIELMKAETFMSADQALEYGFITEIEQVMRAVALLKTNNPMSETITKEEFKQEMSGFQKMLNSALEKLGVSKPKAIILQDANGVEVDFYERTEGDPEVGDKANVDGSPASGDYVMADGSTFTFESGSLTAIAPAEAEEPEDVAALKQENETLKQEIETLKTTNQKLEETSNEALETAKKLETTFANFKEKVTSNFNLNLEEEKPRGEQDEDQPTTRKLFKD